MSWTRLAGAGLQLDRPLEQRIEQHDDGGAEHRAGEVGHATEDDDGEDRQREEKPNTPGRGQLEPRASSAPAKPASAEVMPNTTTL